MIDAIILQLFRATIFLAIGFPVVWLLIHFSRFRSALGQRIVWGFLLVVSFLCMTLPVRIPVYLESVDHTTKEIDSSTDKSINSVQQMENFDHNQRDNANVIHETTILMPNEQRAHDDSFTRMSLQLAFKQGRTILLFGAWLAGLTLLFGCRFCAYKKLMTQLDQSPSIDDTQWSTLLQEHGILPKRIPILSTESTGPALVRHSLARFSFIVPKSLWSDMQPNLRHGILRHELGHYRHGDTILSPLLFFLAALQWYNPFAWFALRRYDEATEWHADLFAYGDRETGPSELAETLLTIHRSTVSSGLYLNSFLPNFRKHSDTLERVNRLAQNHGKDPLAKKLLIGTILTILLCCGVLRVQIIAQSQETEHIPASVSDEIKVKRVQVLRTVMTENGEKGSAILHEELVVIPDSLEPVFGLKNKEEADKLQKKDSQLNILYHFSNGNWINTRTGKVVFEARIKAGDITILLDKPDRLGRITAFRSKSTKFAYYTTLFAVTQKQADDSEELTFTFDAMMKSVSRDTSPVVFVHHGDLSNQDYGKKELDQLSGQVLDENGHPLENILVQVKSNEENGTKTIPGKDTKTNVDGRFSLQGPFLITWNEDHGRITSWMGPRFIFTGPGREQKTVFLQPKDNELNVTLNRGTIIQGQVIDNRTGKGAPHIEVKFCSMTRPHAWPKMSTKTDNKGQYRTEFCLPPDRYILFVYNQHDPTDETVGKLENVEVTLDNPVFQAPELLVDRCGWIEGKFVHADTKIPIKVNSANIDHVCTSQTKYKIIITQKPYLLVTDTTFKAKAFPGDNILHILTGPAKDQVKGLDHYCTKPIQVQSGESVSLQLEVMSADTVESLGSLPEPIEAEREAAEAVKRLGGWYRVHSRSVAASLWALDRRITAFRWF